MPILDRGEKAAGDLRGGRVLPSFEKKNPEQKNVDIKTTETQNSRRPAQP